MKAGVAPATLARPMQPMRIERVAAQVEANGHDQWPRATAHGNGNGNGTNGKRHEGAGHRPDRQRRGQVLVEVGGE